MKRFLDEDFLLDGGTARRLYHEVAALEPIIDFHGHLPPDQIAADHRFADLTELWLAGDHYKWRAMRTAGVPERFITGDASPRDKFDAWARTVPQTLRNPLYHWTHLELANPFGVRGRLLGPETADAIWTHCNRLLAGEGFTTQGLLRRFRVLVVCTTDDPADGLEAHAKHAANTAAATRMLPTWRPDRALGVDDPTRWNEWVDRLGARANVDVRTLDDLREALRRRHDAFHALGCRLSDHGLETFHADESSEAELRATFDRARAGSAPAPDAVAKFRSALLHELALLDHARGWVQQFHVGALRDNNTRMRRALGPDTGFDSIGDLPVARPLSRFLDRLDSTDQLAKTVLYNLNPRDNEVYATMLGNFQDGRVPGKIQYGAAWWFLDQKDGIERHLDALSNMGLLARFVGMLTDSRSFLSFSRHEYFRRILCNRLGDEVDRGLLPDDFGLLSTLVRDVCFGNAQRYFDLPLGTR